MAWQVYGVNADARQSAGSVTSGLLGNQAPGRLALMVGVLSTYEATPLVGNITASPFAFTSLINAAIPGTNNRLIVLGRVLDGSESTNITLTSSVSAGTIRGMDTAMFVISGNHQTLASIITAYAMAGDFANFVDPWPTVPGPTPAIAKNGSMAIFVAQVIDGFAAAPTDVGVWAPPNEDASLGGTIHALGWGYDLGPLAIGNATAYPASGKPSGASTYGYRSLAVLVLRAPNTQPTVPGAQTAPTNGATLPVNVAATVTFGVATDPDGDTLAYTIQRAKDGGAWSTIASGIASPTTPWTPTEPGSYQFRCWASDAETTGPTTTGNTVTVVPTGGPRTIIGG